MPDDDKGGQGADPTQAFQNRLKKYDGDALQFATVLFDENFRQRNRIRDLEAKVPGEDSAVLKKEDADRLAAFDALGLKPEDAKKKIDGLAEVEKERDTLRRETSLRAVADAGYSFDALRDFDALEPGLEYVVKDEKKDGKDVKAVYVKVEGKERPLDEYAAEKRPAQAKILRAEGGQQQGRQWPSQDAGGKPPQGETVYDKHVKEVQEKYGKPEGQQRPGWQQQIGLAQR